MKNSSLEQDPENLIEKRPPYGGTTQSPSFIKAIIAGAIDAAELRSQKMLLFEDDAVSEAFAPRERIGITKVNEEVVGLDNSKELVVSFRAAFSAFIVSLVDSAPSEIAVATFKNMNAIATWGMQRATDSTIYITVTSVQVDNMVPNAPFPVAVCPFDQPRNIGTEADGTPEDSAPLLVIGLSFAPRHKSGIVVRIKLVAQ